MARSRGRLRVLITALLLTGLTLAARAQNDEARIPPSISSATSVLNADQQKVIDAYVSRWIDKLARADAQDVTQARDKLIEPFNYAGATDVYLTAYSAAVSRKLPPIIRADQPLVRINGMLVLQNVSEHGVVDMIRTGLEDANAAVRYLAAKAAGKVGSNPRVTTDQKKNILAAMQSAMAKEQQAHVIEQLLLGMLGVADLPEAREQLIAQVNRRVEIHAQTPNMSVKAPLEVLSSLYRRLVAESVPDKTSIQKLVPVACRWLLLSSVILNQKLAEPGAETQYGRMVEIADAILRWGANQLAPELAGGFPKAFDDSIRTRDWGLVKVRAEEWKTVLGKAPLSYDANQLNVTLP